MSIATSLPRGAFLLVLNQKTGPSLSMKLVFGLEFAHEMNGILRRLVERPVEDPVLRIGAFSQGEDQVLAVVRDSRSGPPVLVLAVFPDERVVLLRRADPVVGHLLVIIRRLEVVAWPGFGKPAVKEALAVGAPLGRRELDPFQVVAQVLAGGDVADFPFVPVRPAAAVP